MKRILTTLLIFCFVLCLLPVSAFAATGTYDLDELGMSIELPSDHVVFTRDIKANDPNLSAYGLTKDGLSSLMQERSIYLVPTKISSMRYHNMMTAPSGL